MAAAASIEARDDGAVRFVIDAPDDRARDLLPKMGYLPDGDAGGRCVTRWFPPAAGAARYLARFNAAIGPMLRQTAGLETAPWEDALLAFLRRVEGTGLDWWLYGSAALAVRGLAVAPGDVDVRVHDAFALGRVLDDWLVTPVERMRGWVAAEHGRAFRGAVVEWIARPDPALDDPAAPHEQGALIAPEIEVAHWRGHAVRVPPLSASLRSCEQRGLHDRAALVRAAIARGGLRA